MEQKTHPVQGVLMKADQEGDHSLLCLKRDDGSLFVVKDYSNNTRGVGCATFIKDCYQIEDYKNAKGVAFKQYSNEHKVRVGPEDVGIQKQSWEATVMVACCAKVLSATKGISEENAILDIYELAARLHGDKDK